MKILNFYTSTHPSCEALNKVLEKVNVEVEDINALEDIANVDKYNVCAVPTLVFLNSEGEEVARTIGILTLRKIRKIIKDR